MRCHRTDLRTPIALAERSGGLLRGGAAVAAALAVAASLATVTAPSASADPDDTTSLADAKKQLAALEEQQANIADDYNQVGERLTQARKKHAKATKAVAAKTTAVKRLRVQVGQLAVDRYQNAGIVSAAGLVTSEDAQQFLRQLSLNAQVDAAATDLVTSYVDEQRELRKAQVRASVGVASITVDAVQADILKTRADAKVDAAQKVVDSLTAKQRAALAKKAKAEKREGSDVSRSAGRGSASGAIAFARAQVGDAYSMGSTGPNAYDCSGLMLAAYKSVGISLPRTSQAQYSAGVAVSRGDLQPGDLVFFYGGISHVGMYIGDGMIVHAANPRTGVAYAPLSSMPYAGARRVG